jgi:uncharacterized protein
VARAFLDANVLFSAAYRPDSGLARLWRLNDVELITSAYAVDEAIRNLGDDEQRARLSLLMANVILVAEPPTDMPLPPGVPLPAKDAPILLAAIQAGADYLLTGDKTHFGAFFNCRIGGVLIEPPATFFAARADAP